jgi:tricorn protease
MSRSGTLAFSRGGELYLLRPGAKDPERVAVNVAQSALAGESPSQTSSFNDIVPSPTGKEIALVTRGDIFVASLNGRYVKRITRTPGEERNPSFSPDGRKLVYAAERDGRWSLYEAGIVDPDEKSFFEATRIEEKLLQAGKDDAMTPVYAPDGKHVAYIANRDSVRVLDVATKADIEILPKGMNYFYGDWSWWLSWSPDSKWLAFPIQPSQQIDNVAVAPADGHAPPMRVAPSGEDQSPAEWSQDGSFLLWASDAEGLRYINGRSWSADIEGVYTSRKARDAFEQKLRVPVIGDAPSDRTRKRRMLRQRTAPGREPPSRARRSPSSRPASRTGRSG